MIGRCHEYLEYRSDSFSGDTHTHPSKWGYGRWGEEHETTQTVTKISTDDGAEGYMLGGEERYIDGIVKPMILGENPLEREKLWNWMARHL